MATQGEIFQGTGRMDFDGINEINNVYQFRLESAVPITDEEAVDDILEIIDDVIQFLTTFLSVLVVARDIVVRRLSPATVFGAFPWPTFTAGVATADATPPGVAGQVYFSTAIPRVILRKYYGVFNETQISTAGDLRNTVRDAMALIGAKLLLSITATNGVWRYGYFSPKVAGFVEPTVATIPTPFSYQRRRKPGVGS